MNINLDAKPHYILNGSCDSRIGTAARVTNFLASRECFIAEMQLPVFVLAKYPLHFGH